MSELQDVTLTGVGSSAALDALLAIEAYAERMYPKRARLVNADTQRRYNDLAAIVLPLRAAMDAAFEREGEAQR